MQSNPSSANWMPLSTGYIKYQWVYRSWYESFKRCSERIFFTSNRCMEIFANIFIRSDPLHHSRGHSELWPRMCSRYSKKSRDWLIIHFKSTSLCADSSLWVSNKKSSLLTQGIDISGHLDDGAEREIWTLAGRTHVISSHARYQAMRSRLRSGRAMPHLSWWRWLRVWLIWECVTWASLNQPLRSPLHCHCGLAV